MESEIARLGEEHITIRTQYRLLPISGAGFLLNDLQRSAMQVRMVPVELRHERFGKEAITRAVLLDRDPGVSMPLLPD